MFLGVLQPEVLLSYSRLSFQRCSDDDQSQKVQCLSPGKQMGLLTVQDHEDNVYLWSKGWAGLLPIIKHSGSLGSGSSPITDVVHVQESAGPLNVCPVGLRTWGTGPRKY